MTFIKFISLMVLIIFILSCTSFIFFSATSNSPHVTVTPSPLNELKQSISYQLLLTSEGNGYKTMN